MSTTLLMADKNMLQPTLLLSPVNSVVDGQNRPTWVTEDSVNAMAAKGIHQGIRSDDSPMLQL
jgi:hypothetical protein|tara:strand:+ start:1037 stop:1225 length:189 start_codon:yes stop_codon:yes gene_type:complete